MTKRKELDPDQAAALHQYKVKYGVGWKRLLMEAWLTGDDVKEPNGHLLRQVRNQYGPSWLQRH